MFDTKEMLAKAIQSGASDVHINVQMPPIMRINTELIVMDLPEITDENAHQMVLELVGQDKFNAFLQKRDFDFSTMIDDGSRFRVNAHYQRDSIAISFRVISSKIPEIEDLHLPDIVKELTDLPRGLVIVTGHTGSGKSTTLASMIGVMNRKYRKRIITLEDPVEYLLINKSCMIEQREIGSDCPTFASGLRHALRQDPDVILVGEMRDLETTSSTITAAETGHLVLATMHSPNVSHALERIIGVFEGSAQRQIILQLSNALQGIISQELLPAADRTRRVLAYEMLVANGAVRNLIRENQFHQLENILQTGRKEGMVLMDNCLYDLYCKCLISYDTAVSRARHPERIIQPKG